jgi:hypothetical protein
VFWRAFALVEDNARGRRHYARSSGAAASFLACLESLLLAFLHEAASQSEFSHDQGYQVNQVLEFRSRTASFAARLETPSGVQASQNSYEHLIT